jgi:hypothetical protein
MLLSERWPSRLVATAAEERLTTRAIPHTLEAVCRASGRIVLRVAQKEGPAHLAEKRGGAKSLGCGKDEGSSNPPPTQPGARRHGSPERHDLFQLCLLGNWVRSLPQNSRDLRVIAHIFILSRSRSLPRFGGALYSSYQKRSAARYTSRPTLGERWPSRLVATAAEDRLKFLNVLRYAHWVAAYWVLILLLASFVSSFVNWLLNQAKKNEVYCES